MASREKNRKTRANGNKKNSTRSASKSRPLKKRDSGRTSPASIFPVVGIGASAGGLEAYLDLFRLLPADTGMAFVLVQHLSPKHLSMLSAIVQKSTRMKVQEIADETKILPNNVYVIPPNSVLEIFHGVLHLSPMKLPHATNRLIDSFFSSLARDRKNLAIGIILSGTGSDGSQGLRDIKAEGGISIIQEPQTAKFDGMPRMAMLNDHPDYVVPIKGIVDELVKIARNPHFLKLMSTEENNVRAGTASHLRKIFIKVRGATGTDFSVYKYPTIIRRIRRRMLLQGIDSLKGYYEFLESSKEEVNQLFNDLLINVTEFFRDPKSYDKLKSKVFPEIIKDRDEGAPIRAWVPGCSTGEEVYSIAIALIEFLAESKSNYPIQIYGTDVSPLVIQRARAGVYTDAIKDQLSEAQLNKYFVKIPEGYRIAKFVRDCCVFSVQDVTIDPPIHRLDLLSCRNLMIYLDPDIQNKLLHTFYYALAPRGFLFLGTSESIGSAASFFAIVDETTKIFSRRMTAPIQPLKISKLNKRAPVQPLNKSARNTHNNVRNPVNVAEELVLEEYAPAWLLVTHNMDIVHFRGNTEVFIAPRSGQPSWNLIKMLRADLIAPVRLLIHRCQKSGKTVRITGLKVKGDSLLVDVEVRRIDSSSSDYHYLVVFSRRSNSKTSSKLDKKTPTSQVVKLSKELEISQASIRSFLDDQNATYQELQSANEEVLAANEELQSTNEELETTKEELQSTNEELITLNEELSNRNAEISMINSDLSNVLNNSHVPIVIVSNDLLIRRLTPAAAKLLNIAHGDIGRKLTDFNLGFDIGVLTKKLEEVRSDLIPNEIELSNYAGNYYSVRIRPYISTENRIDGTVLTFIDIDASKTSENMAEETRRYSDAIIDTINDPLVILNKDLMIERVNRAFYLTFKVREQDTIGKFFYDLGNGQWNIPELKSLLEEILPRESEMRDFRVSRIFQGIGERTMLINAKKLGWARQTEIFILLAIRIVAPQSNVKRKKSP